MDPNTEIRKLRPAELYKLARILATSDSWKTLMAVVPKEGTKNELKFNAEHFALIEQASCQQRKSGAEIFLEEWSTMGKQRPTLESTLDLLVDVELFRAADYIAVDLLQRERPKRPECGPAAQIDISDEEIAKLLNQKSSESQISDFEFSESKESLASVLDEFGYPSTLSVQSSVEHHEQEVRQRHEDHTHHQSQRIGLEFNDQISNLRSRPEEINKNNSDLMQFSISDIELQQNNRQHPNWQHNNSNLIQFSTNSIRGTNTTDLDEKFLLANGVYNTHLGGNAQTILQRQNVIHTSSSNNEDEYSSLQMIRGENIHLSENGVQAQKTTGMNEYSSAGNNDGSVSSSNDCHRFESQSSELPACLADIRRDSTSMYSEAKSSELPQFVVEIARQRYNQSDTAPDTESFREPILSNDSNSSDNSSDFLSNVTGPSNNDTESNIPICVNFPLPSSENNELVSAELPQFVADLGHRQNNDNSTETIDSAASEFVNNPLNEQFQYLGLNSQELPLVVLECNKMRSQLEEKPKELETAELPLCIADLQNVNKK